MKSIFLIPFVVLAAQALSEEYVQEEWKNFGLNFGKSYKSPLENRKRFAIFRENLEKIEEHNQLYRQGLKSYEQGVTPFTDWTREEFSSYINKFKFEPFETEHVHVSNSSLKAPDSIDWRDKDAVREVKNQGDCGSCWSFSATGAMEAQATLQKGLKISLSEQNLMDCSGEEYNNYACDGGTQTGAFYYVQFHGIDIEENYPYLAAKGKCRKPQKVAFQINYYTKILPANEDTLKEVVGTLGPAAVSMEATDDLQNYKSGVFYDETCVGSLNHGVLAVGYGSENGQDYWLIKNSWGAQWGDAGFFKLARNRDNHCGIARSGSYPTVL